MNLGNIINQHFYFGAGAGNFETAYEKFSDLAAGPEKIYTHSHQVLLELWVGTGLVGAICWFVLHWLLFTQWRKSSARLLALPFLLVPFIMWMPFNSHRNIYSSELMQFTWLWLAMAIGLLYPKLNAAKDPL